MYASKESNDMFANNKLLNMRRKSTLKGTNMKDHTPNKSVRLDDPLDLDRKDKKGCCWAGYGFGDDKSWSSSKIRESFENL